MPAVAQVSKSKAGGTINGPGVSSVKVEGYTISVIGDNVQGHGLPPHSSPTMAQGSSTVFAGGKAVCRQGDAASCGHTANNCASTVNAN
jgi:uncharacterized Zn-binding protein involved in type VI secretion